MDVDDDDIPDDFSNGDEDDTAEVKALRVNILSYILESN
jgi:hypothetical protein